MTCEPPLGEKGRISVSLVSGGPAERAGVCRGDRLLWIDGNTVSELTNSVLSKMVGGLGQTDLPSLYGPAFEQSGSHSLGHQNILKWKMKTNVSYWTSPDSHSLFQALFFRLVPNEHDWPDTACPCIVCRWRSAGTTWPSWWLTVRVSRAMSVGGCLSFPPWLVPTTTCHIHPGNSSWSLDPRVREEMTPTPWWYIYKQTQLCIPYAGNSFDTSNIKIYSVKTRTFLSDPKLLNGSIY